MRKQKLIEERNKALAQLAHQNNLLAAIVNKYCRGKAVVADSEIEAITPATELTLTRAHTPDGLHGTIIQVVTPPPLELIIPLERTHE